MFGRPELCFLDKIESELPGAILYSYGQGRSTYVPWDIDLLYEASGMPGYEKALQGVVLDLLDGERQVVTNTHPTVEINLFEHPQGDYVMILVNSSGYAPPAVREPVPMSDIEIKFKPPKRVGRARSVATGQELDLWEQDGYTGTRLSQLGLFDTILFEPTD